MVEWKQRFSTVLTILVDLIANVEIIIASERLKTNEKADMNNFFVQMLYAAKSISISKCDRKRAKYFF